MISLRGLDIADPEKRADHMIYQMLEGTRVGDGNRQAVRAYLIEHFQSYQTLRQQALEALTRAKQKHGSYDDEREELKSLLAFDCLVSFKPSLLHLVDSLTLLWCQFSHSGHTHARKKIRSSVKFS